MTQEKSIATIEPKWLPPTELVKIIDQSEYDLVLENSKYAKRFQSKVVKLFEKMKKIAWQAHKVVVAEEKNLLVPAKEYEDAAKLLMQDFDREKEEMRQQAEAEANKKALAEAEAEQLAEAEHAQASGAKQAEVEAILDRPVQAQHVVIPEIKQKNGVSTRTDWDWMEDDKSKIKIQFMIPDEKAINALVKSLGQEAVAVVGGIKVFKKEIMAIRA